MLSQQKCKSIPARQQHFEYGVGGITVAADRLWVFRTDGNIAHIPRRLLTCAFPAGKLLMSEGNSADEPNFRCVAKIHTMVPNSMTIWFPDEERKQDPFLLLTDTSKGKGAIFIYNIRTSTLMNVVSETNWVRFFEGCIRLWHGYLFGVCAISGLGYEELAASLQIFKISSTNSTHHTPPFHSRDTHITTTTQKIY